MTPHPDRLLAQIAKLERERAKLLDAIDQVLADAQLNTVDTLRLRAARAFARQDVTPGA